MLRKGGREEGREGLHESSHVRVLNGGRCPASLPGSPPLTFRRLHLGPMG